MVSKAEFMEGLLDNTGIVPGIVNCKSGRFIWLKPSEIIPDLNRKNIIVKLNKDNNVGVEYDFVRFFINHDQKKFHVKSEINGKVYTIDEIDYWSYVDMEE